jgi:hypothetical protein
MFIYAYGGTWLRSWLRHYATSRKVACSSPDEVDFFNLPNPSNRTMALGSTQSLTEMSTRNLSGGVKDGRRVRLIILPPSVSRLSRENVEASTSHNPMGLHGLLQGYLYLFYIWAYFVSAICILVPCSCVLNLFLQYQIHNHLVYAKCPKRLVPVRVFSTKTLHAFPLSSS